MMLKKTELYYGAKMSPILVLGFKRAEKIDRLLGSLEKISVRKIYVSVDGPRSDDEAEDVFNVRATVRKHADQSKHKYELWMKDINEGGPFGTPRSIDWAFGSESQLIILEDDLILTDECAKILDFNLEDVNLVQLFSPVVIEKNAIKLYRTANLHLWGWIISRDIWFQNRPDKKSELPSVFCMLIYSKLNIFLFLENFSIRKLLKNDIYSWDYQLKMNLIKHRVKTFTFYRPLVIYDGFDEAAQHGQVLNIPSTTYYLEQDIPSFGRMCMAWQFEMKTTMHTIAHNPICRAIIRIWRLRK